MTYNVVPAFTVLECESSALRSVPCFQAPSRPIQYVVFSSLGGRGLTITPTKTVEQETVLVEMNVQRLGLKREGYNVFSYV